MSCNQKQPVSSAISQSDSLPEPKVHVRTVDSLAIHVTSLDSLKYWTNYYADKKDSHGELVLHKATGVYYQRTSNYMEAVDEYSRVLVLAESQNDTAQMIEALNLLGESYRYLGVIGQSADCYFRALRLCEVWSDQTSKLARTYKIRSLNGIGGAQVSLGNFVRAEGVYRKALAGDIELKNYSGLAVDYANIGIIKEKQGQLDSAFFYFERSLEQNRNTRSKLGIAMCYNHFGRLAEASGDLDAALRYYYRAYNIMEHEAERRVSIESALSMARVYMERGDMADAKRFLDEAWSFAERTRSWKMMSETSLLLSEYDERVGNSKSALKWYKKSISYGDSVTNERTRAFVHRLREDFVRERNESELSALRESYTAARATNRAFFAWALLAGVFAVLCIIGLLYMLRVRMRSQSMLKHMEKVRTDFFTNITHEFRTPLTVMLGLAKQIADGQVIGDQKECQRIGSMMMRQGNSLLELVNQLLDIVKAESAIGKADWRSGDISPYLAMIIENCQEFANLRKVSLAYTGERELQMDFVPDYIRKVLQNLLTNAIKYSGEGGKVNVQMNRKGEEMELIVVDSGRGIPEKDLPHIFDAFYTATNCGIEVSAGVGLAMVRQMVHAMKGMIAVESKIGKGTTFIIRFPLRQGEERFRPIQENGYNKSLDYVPQHNYGEATLPEDDPENEIKSSVLVIEDNRDVATYIGMQLTDRYRVIYATNGIEGLNKARYMIPDLIVTDLMMPEMDGYEVCRQIRKSGGLSHTPIIIVSAKSTAADRLKGLEAGADAYLFKPFNAEELQLLVSNMIGQRKLLRQKCIEKPSDSPTDGTLLDLRPSDRDFLNKFVDVVYSQMPKGFVDAESLASAMCMSSSQLRRRIFAITNEKLTTYVLQLRLKQALRLLDVHNELSVADIALRCGFEDAAYFSRIFKNVYQMTPSQYRRQGGLPNVKHPEK